MSTMQSATLVLPALPAASDPIAYQLYNQDHIDKDVKGLLKNHLTSMLNKEQKVKILILGGRCGMIAEILLPFSTQIDVVEQDLYADILQERFVQRRQVDYFFGREGFIGNRHLCQPPNINDQKVRIIRAQNLKKQVEKHYNIILIQNNITTKSSSLIQELIGIEHDHLITMIVPGKITEPHVFQFFALFERNIISAFYENVLYERLQNKVFITGRRQEVIYYEIFVWKRNKEPISEEIVKALLKVEAQTNQNKVDNIYQTQKMVDMYVKFHYGEEHFGIQNFPLKCAQICIEEAKKHNKNGRVLDLGCAVGRSTIELAQYFKQSVGLDYSQAFIKSANQILKDKYASLQSKVKFVVGDACNLDTSLGKYDLIFGGNLIDRLPDPAAFLKSITSFLEPKGILILTSPYTWLEQYTNPTKWVGGIIENGVSISTQQGLKRILGQIGVKPLRDSEDIRFTIKMNDWVYMYTLANATFWIKSE